MRTKAAGRSTGSEVRGAPVVRSSRAVARRVVAAALGIGMAVIPLGAAVAFALAAGRIAPPRDGVVLWWAAVFIGSTVVASVAGRLVRRLFPLVGLLRLALLVPGDVDSRVGAALRAGGVRQLERGVLDLRDGPALIVALAGALQRHDRFTRGHCERVRAYTDLLARELGLSRSDREQLRWAALLHDVGKIEVSPRILNKPAALDDDEWREMRTHPVVSARLVEPLRPMLGEWTDASGQHHERFDGLGYPGGLEGHDISLGGRIVAVADSYETMTAARPYKPATPHAAAREELVAQAGRHFDPVVVRAMLSLSTRRLRWAAGPVAAVGDAIAARWIVALGPRAAAAGTSPAVLPWAGGAAAAVVLAVAGVAPATRTTDLPPRRAEPVAAEVVEPIESPTTTTTVATATTAATTVLEDAPATTTEQPLPLPPPPTAPPRQAPTPVAAQTPATPSPVADDPPAVPATPAVPAVPAAPAVPGVSRATPATPAIPASPANPNAGRGRSNEPSVPKAPRHSG